MSCVVGHGLQVWFHACSSVVLIECITTVASITSSWYELRMMMSFVFMIMRKGWEVSIIHHYTSAIVDLEVGHHS